MTLAPIPVEGYAFLDAIAAGEDADSRDYDELCGSTRANPKKFTDATPRNPNGFPLWEGWHDSHAAGRYQDEPATWDGICRATGLRDFSPASQDAGNWWLAQDDYHRKSNGRDLMTDIRAAQFQAIATTLQSTWTSLDPATLGDRYAAALKMRAAPGPIPIPAPQPAPAPAPAPAPIPSDNVTITLSPALARIVRSILVEVVQPELATLITSLEHVQ